MRRASRIDDNQTAIVAALREAGYSVQSLAGVGEGVPDLLIGKFEHMVLFEVKDGVKPPSARRLTPAQIAWHLAWKGPQPIIVCSVDEALAFAKEELGSWEGWVHAF